MSLLQLQSHVCVCVCEWQSHCLPLHSEQGLGHGSRILGPKRIMRNAGLQEAQAGIKIAQRNINSLKYADAAKSLQSFPTLCDPIDGSPPGSPVPGILQARTLEWVAISFSNAWKWKVKVKSLSHVRLFATPWTAAYQAPLSMGFSRQEYWSGLPFTSRLYIVTLLI